MFGSIPQSVGQILATTAATQTTTTAAPAAPALPPSTPAAPGTPVDARATIPSFSGAAAAAGADAAEEIPGRTLPLPINEDELRAWATARREAHCYSLLAEQLLEAAKETSDRPLPPDRTTEAA